MSSSGVSPIMQQVSTKPRVVVAMSGGVDSSAAALLLAKEGYEVIGVSMQVWDYRNHGGSASRATCCAPSDFDDAREIADQVGFPYYVFDFEKSFRKSVIEPFIDSYLEGKTPNPCLNCNRHVKFKQLRDRAKYLNSEWVATGHFAQIKPLNTGELGLYTSVDGDKDQTYFLYAMRQHDLEHTLFPVGGMKKCDVRKILDDHGFSIASKAESQDICFVGDKVSSFIESQRGKQESGEIKAKDGKVLGQHQGVHQFTVGQRKGLGVSSHDPLYVIQIDSDSKEVVVGSKQDLEQRQFFVEDLNWINDRTDEDTIEAVVKLRYRHPGVRCKISRTDSANSYKFEFLDQWTAVSPGQAAVCYAIDSDSDGSIQVLGGGIICK